MDRWCFFFELGSIPLKICSYVALWQRYDGKGRKIIWWCIDFVPIAVIRYSSNISVRRKGFILIHNSRNSSLWWGSQSGRRLKWLLSHHICRHAAQLCLSTCKVQDLSHTEWYRPWRTGLPTSTYIIKIIFHRHTPMPLSQVILDSSLQLTLTIKGKSRQVSRLLRSCCSYGIRIH